MANWPSPDSALTRAVTRIGSVTATLSFAGVTISMSTGNSPFVRASTGTFCSSVAPAGRTTMRFSSSSAMSSFSLEMITRTCSSTGPLLVSENRIVLWRPPRVKREERGGTIAPRILELTRAHGADITAALETFQGRLARIGAGGIAIEEADFSAEFGRNFEYYTGFVFEVLSPQLGPKSPLAGRGRYDRMLKSVGAKSDVAAVGAAIYTERVRLAVEGGRS